MKRRTSNEIRRLFLDFFVSKGHKVEDSSPLVPMNDPTLLWINSGVAALKPYFDGSIIPDNRRICNAQKSLRTNDIEEVGKTARHHTFFEMLGNFSIGDYFREDAIAYAWEFLTSPEWLGLEKEKLYITVHPGDADSYNEWVNVHKVDPSHILKTEYNYWEIGEGPSGPNTEIFYDRGSDFDPDNVGIKLFMEELENDRYVEIWNIVFSQFNAKSGVPREKYEELPQKNIDTGMGFERITCIIQDGETNYDTDLFIPLLAEVGKLTDAKYSDNKLAYKIIVDHIRTITFAIADGAAFSNEGRGYVLRRLLRRAYRYGKKIGIEKPFMHQLVQIVADIMEDYYPYLQSKVEYIEKLVKIEEERFEHTLNDGEKLLLNLLDDATNKILSGKDAFKLYDTYGFPLELTIEIANEQGCNVDTDGYEKEMELQKKRARNARVDSQSMGSQSEALINFFGESTYNYSEKETKAKVIAILKDGEFVDKLSGVGMLIFDTTNFYAESGGQVSDLGVVVVDGREFEVSAVSKAPNGQHLHLVECDGIEVGSNVTLKIDRMNRRAIKKNHSSLHLLQQALIDVLGSHVTQAGSYVCSEYARFDFTHFEKMSKEDIAKVEELVNLKIAEALEVEVSTMEIEKAKERGALALFGDKYSDIVRVVDMDGYAVELCGGTHVSNTAEIGIFKILFEESIGSGIRRLQVATGLNVYYNYKHTISLLDKIANISKERVIDNLPERVKMIQETLGINQATLSEMKAHIASLNLLKISNKAMQVDSYKFLISEIDLPIKVSNLDADSINKETIAFMRLMIDSFKEKENGIIVLLNNDSSQLKIAIGVSNALVDKYQAGDIAKKINLKFEGKGGGNKSFAQTVIANTQDVDSVKNAIREVLNIK